MCKNEEFANHLQVSRSRRPLAGIGHLRGRLTLSLLINENEHETNLFRAVGINFSPGGLYSRRIYS
jgi:hypothetical protein